MMTRPILFFISGLVFLTPGSANGQIPHPTNVSVTRAGQPVAVRLANPFLQQDQELALLDFLREPSSFKWDRETTLSDVQRDLCKRIAFDIDVYSLEEIGLSVDEKVCSGNPLPAHQEDSSISGQSSLEVTGVASETHHWWNLNPKSASAIGLQETTNAAKLFSALDQLDLTITNRYGQWTITTMESAEQQLNVRLYDVTPIVTVKTEGVRANRPPQAYRDDAIISLIESCIDPDGWESLGGPSSHQLFTVHDRHWLVMSTRITTHWKIQSLLNQLNDAR